VLLNSGDAVGRYVVLAPAGTGGMGEVYKARDTRLNRIVALKVIGTGGGARSDLAQRFASEARAIAALNHPHICALYDTGCHDNQEFLVLEYLEGETLAQRLKRGPLSSRELLLYAIQIAEGLDYAHRQGVVHRDLKPSNVLLTKSAGAKLLDFGLAKLRTTTSHFDSISGLATKPLQITTEGAIVGTLHYLAPERLEGREADARSDVFAFGAILYEMITGRKPFEEKSQARLIAAILSDEPAPLQPPPGMPSALQWVVQTCLAKEPDARWQSMGDVARVLKGVPDTAPHAEPSPVPRRKRAFWMAVAFMAVAGVAAATGWLLRSLVSDPHRTRAAIMLSVLPPTDHAFALTESTVKNAQFAVAPDGQTIAFVARAGRVQQLWIRELSRPEPRMLPGTEGASFPFWSPDSRFIGFFADKSLKKVGLDGRSPITICQALNGRGATWHEDGTIVFSPENSTPLYRVSAASGNPAPLTALANGHLAHRWPQFLTGARVLFFVRSADPDLEGIYVTSLAQPDELRRVRANASSGLYASGRLLYVLDGALVAQPIDESTLTLSGEATPLGLRVSVSSALNPAVSVSTQGVLATWSSTGNLSELVWYDRQGQRLGTEGPADQYVDFRLSPDDRRLALSRVDRATNMPDVFVRDLGTSALNSVSSSRQTDATPIWSPDGGRLVFRSNRRGLHDLFERPSHGGGEDRLLYSSGFGMYPTDWSSERGAILFHFLARSTKHDIWILDPSRGSAEPLHQTPADEAQGQLAQGGRLAYVSDESGEMNVYVRALNESTGPINVSVDGGFDPRWRADGRELFFLSSNGTLMAADVTTEGPPQVLSRKKLFNTGIQEPTRPYLSNFAVTKDGRRFLINVPTEPPGSAPITVTLDWLSTVSSGSR
jgi:eukaryotic-like serine/threonine-protein kinase